jgi:hypothetical protein
VVLICISFIVKDIEHFFMCLLAIWASFLNKLCSVHLHISSLDNWVIGSLVFWAPSMFWLLIPCQMYG